MKMKPMPMNPNYRAMVRGTLALHELLAAGKDDSPEADAIRDATDGPWDALSEVERNRIRKLSEDLYSLFEPAPALQPMNPQAQAKLNEAFEAKQQREWDRSLDVLRRWRAFIDSALLSYLRGSIWLEAGDPASALLFFKHAYNLNPDNENFLYLFLLTLDLADPKEAQKFACDILSDPEQYSPVVVSRACEIEFKTAMAATETDAQQTFHRLQTILKVTIARFEQQEYSVRNQSIYVAALSLLGASYEYCGETQTAVEYYTQGLLLEPYNDALLIARGILTYGANPRAINDLEMSVRAGTQLVWPYAFLAHHNLLTDRYEECRRLCERALEFDGSPTLMSEISEWLAIAQAALGYPTELIRARFDYAIRTDPSNERAQRNLAVFETSSRPTVVSNWETRSAGAVRMSGRIERRFSMAA